jgi:hypothetical protein
VLAGAGFPAGALGSDAPPVAAASVDASGNLAEGAVEFFVSKTQVEGLL